MTRSLWKGPFVDACLLKITAAGGEQKKPKKIWSRRSCILPQFVGNTVQIYNGKNFIACKVTEEMIGHKFGEFASTRKSGGKKKIKK